MKMRVLGTASAVALSAAMLAVLPAVQASGATMAPSAKSVAAAKATAPTPLPVGQSDGNVSSSALSTWQTDSTVWAVAYGNGVVYVGGQFLNALPPGVAAGDDDGRGVPHLPGRVQLDHRSAHHLVRSGDLVNQ